MEGIACTECGAPLDESPSLPTDQREPCPNCGSMARTIHVSVHETLTVRERMGLKARHGESGKPCLESVSGADLHRKSGKWMHLERVIDREKDEYKEVVKDPDTGTVIHKCEEPLSKHQGHGTAKHKAQK